MGLSIHKFRGGRLDIDLDGITVLWLEGTLVRKDEDDRFSTFGCRMLPIHNRGFEVRGAYQWISSCKHALNMAILSFVLSRLQPFVFITVDALSKYFGYSYRFQMWLKFFTSILVLVLKVYSVSKVSALTTDDFEKCVLKSAIYFALADCVLDGIGIYREEMAKKQQEKARREEEEVRTIQLRRISIRRGDLTLVQEISRSFDN
ncbi:hypothetical protein Ddc_14391 [Ditylenchus destructor]|nr:hypothetical protein Ddc_14391 [Ditylenchus destructor]